MLRDALLSPDTNPLPFLPSPPPLPDEPRSLIFKAAQEDPEISEAERLQVWLKRIQVFADSIQAHELGTALNTQIQSAQSMINSTIFTGLPIHIQTKIYQQEENFRMQLKNSKLVEQKAIDFLTASTHWPLSIVSGLEKHHCSSKHQSLLSLVYDLKTTATHMRDVLNNLVNDDPSRHQLRPQPNTSSLQPSFESKEILVRLGTLESSMLATLQSLCNQHHRDKEDEIHKQRDRLDSIEEAVREARRTHEEYKEAFEEVQHRVHACIAAHKEDQIKLRALEEAFDVLNPLPLLHDDYIFQYAEETILDQCNSNIRISVENLRQDIKKLLQKQNVELQNGLFYDLQTTLRVIGKANALLTTKEPEPC